VLKSRPSGHPFADFLKGWARRAKLIPPGERWMEVDYMFDVPVGLAAEVTGFRHDRSEFEWGQPQFTKLERLD